MRTKILSVLLALICILSLLAPVSLAAPERHAHYRGSFKRPVSSIAELANTAGVEGVDSVYLTGDIKLESDLVIDREIELCLNGYSIDVGAFSIIVDAKGTFSVYDCAEVSKGISGSDETDAPIIINYGSYNHVGGDINAGKRTAMLNKAIMNIVGGVITGTADELVQTTGSALFSFNAGEVRAKGHGVGIAMISAPEDEGAKARDFNAGIAGGRVSAESGSPGAVVVNAPKGRFVLNYGADIQGHGCPGVNVMSGRFETYGGAVIGSDTESAIVGTGGKVELYFSTINSRERYGVEISGDASLLLSGSQDINGGLAGVHLAEGKLFSMSDYGFYGDVRVSIHIENNPEQGSPIAISTPCDQKHVPHFLSANPHCSIKYENGAIYCVYDETVTHFHDVQNYVHELNVGYSDLNKNNYYLSGDVSMSGFYVGKTVNLCLNGHTLRLQNPIKLYPGSTLNIHDCVGTGRIESQGSCFMFLEDSNASIVLNEGTVQSVSAPAVKLSTGGTLVVNGGEISTLTEGVCAVEVTSKGGSISGRGGKISAAGSAIVVNNSMLNLSGSPVIRSSGCAIQCTGLQPVTPLPGTEPGILRIGGSTVLEGESADIYLAPGKLILPQDGLAPAESYSVLAEGAPVVISPVSNADHSASFVSADSQFGVFCGEGNVLSIERAVEISADKTEAYTGESVTFTVGDMGEGAVFAWYIRKSGGGQISPIENSSGNNCTITVDQQPGEYEVYCSVEEAGIKYMGKPVKLIILKDEITELSVSQSGTLMYSGEPLTPLITASATTVRGANVSFAYSADGKNFSEDFPALGPDSGEYTVYYRASAEGCEDVEGQLSVYIEEAAQEEIPLPKLSFSGDLRLYAILASGIVFILLCLVYAAIIIGKKKRSE